MRQRLSLYSEEVSSGNMFCSWFFAKYRNKISSHFIGRLRPDPANKTAYLISVFCKKTMSKTCFHLKLPHCGAIKAAASFSSASVDSNRAKVGTYQLTVR